MRKRVDIEVREGDRYLGFYANGKWVQGCRKCYMLAVMYELIDRYSESGYEVYFTLGGYETDEEVRKRLYKIDR